MSSDFVEVGGKKYLFVQMLPNDFNGACLKCAFECDVDLCAQAPGCTIPDGYFVETTQ